MIATAIDVILVLVPIEAAALVALRRRTGRGPPPRALLANLAAGFLLMVAVRLALAEARPSPVNEIALGGVLLLALAAHLADLAARWRDRPTSG